MEDCETAAPYTLLGFLLRGGDGGFRAFMTDYAARGKNALLWAGLISITFLLLRKLAALVRLWGQGNRIPGPPSPSFFGHSKLIADRWVGQNLIGICFDRLSLCYDFLEFKIWIGCFWQDFGYF